MLASNTFSKEQRRHDIFMAASEVRVFKGGTIRPNDRITIKAIVSQNRMKFDSVVNTYGIDMVVQLVSSLIENGTLASKSNVQLANHGTQQLSGGRDKQHAALEQEAAHSEAKAVYEASQSDLALHERNQGAEQIDVAEAGPIENSSTTIPSKSPSLFPAYVSYHSQHELLKTVQRLLEDCCYDWAVQWIPAVLEEQGWSCSEAVELSTWTATIPQRFDAFSFDATTLGSREALTAVFAATHSLRHAAVHRLRTSVKGIERMLKHAVNLATALQDTERQSTLHGILKELRNTMQTMELDKNDLENQLDEELRNIQEKRAALDRMEQEAMLNMLQQDQENTARISSLFERSIRNLTSIDESSATSMEQDNARGSESGEAFDEVITGDIPDKHSAEGSHPTIDENGWAYPDSKPSKHGKVRAAKGVPTSQGVDDNQHGTADASIGNSDSKPSNQGDSGVGTADSREFITPRIEDDDSKVSSQYTGQYIARDFALA